MNKNSTFLYGALAVIVILVFLLILYFLGRENSQPATINDKVTGFYGAAPINNRCSIQPITEPTTLLPSFDLPQNCQENYTCVQTGVNGNPFGYCKVPLSSTDYLQPIYNCNTVYDCAPPVNSETNPDEIVYCNGTCQTTTLTNWNSKSPKTYGGLYSYCDFNTPCDSGLVCDNVLNNFTTSYGECLIDFNNSGFCNGGSSFGCCTANEQCIYGFCDFNKGSNSYGICISRIEPATKCDVDFCETGFGCDFSQPLASENLCQPLLGPNNPAQYGKESSYCKIGTVSGSGDFMACDAGLVCNYDLSINGINNTNYPVSKYPSLVGIGQCVLNKVSLGNTCNAGVGCEEPLVCNNGTCTIPGYLYSSSSSNQTVDINYCGPEKTSPNTNYPINGSSGACLNGYTCVNTNMGIFSESDFCVGVSESTTAIGLCNSDNSSGQKYGKFCNNSTGGGSGCGGRYIGVFLQGYSYLGVWRFIELPPQNIAANVVNANSKISVFQTVTTTGSNVTYPITRIIFFPNVNIGDNFFFYTEFSTYNIDPNGANNLKYSPTWYKINVSMNAAHNHLFPNQQVYINNSTIESTWLSGVDYTTLNYAYDTLSYQLVGGGGSGGAGFDGSGVSSYGGGGGGSGRMTGYVGGTDSGFKYNFIPTPVQAKIINLPIVGYNYFQVTLGSGGAAVISDTQNGNPGGDTYLKVYQDSGLTIQTFSDVANGGAGGYGGDNGPADGGGGGDGFNGGGGGSGGKSGQTHPGGMGDYFIGGEYGNTAPNNDQSGAGGGIGAGIGQYDSNSGSSIGGGGGAGSGVILTSGARTGGDGGTSDNAVPGGAGLDYTGAGGGGGTYAEAASHYSSGAGGKGYAILNFYFANQGQLVNLLDIKFTPSGNFALFVEETMPINYPFSPGSINTGGTPETYKRIYWESFNTLIINPLNPSAGGTLIYTASKNGPMFCNPSLLPSHSNPGDYNSINSSTFNNMYFNNNTSYYTSNTFVWDIDDLYNNSIVVGFKESLSTGPDFIFFSSTVSNIGGNFALNDVTTLGTFNALTINSGYPNYVKYYTDFTISASDTNFLYNYNTSGQNQLVCNNNPSTDYFDIELGSPLSFGLSFSKYGSINNFIYYYMSGNGEIRSVLAKKGETQPTESNVYGYAPVEIVTFTPFTSNTLMLGFTSMANIDNSLYALVETCA
jgi:hypothetical protein